MTSDSQDFPDFQDFPDYSMMRKRFTINFKDRQCNVGQRTLVVGVLNITPDSFSDGGQHVDTARAVDRALALQEQGADILEIGGESTRPGAAPVPLEEEVARILPVLKTLAGKLTIPISIDTYKNEVARQALDHGADFINDVSALRFDEALAKTIADSKAGLILMHMRGTPATMQELEPSENIFDEIIADMKLALSKAESRGVKRNQIIFDPGIGFGKTLAQNLLILNHLDRFDELNLPVMIGTSRKSFIGKITGRATDERVFGTAASVAAAILRGAHFVRVHDVREMVEVTRLIDAIISAG
jgi:dihydropteroate synthase